MQYFIAFLEGIITFVSPCLLPMLPIYISYFAGSSESNRMNTLKNSVGFVLGFTTAFTTMGAFAGTIGSFLKQYQTTVNMVSGLIIILFGLNFLGVVKIPIFRGNGHSIKTNELGFFSSFTFGIVFSIGWTPCVGAFLGSALMMASQQGSTLKGVLMLLSYSMGLGIPFIASALLIDQLKSVFDFIKRNYKTINIFSGIILIIVGIMMMTGAMGYLLSMLTF